MSHCIDVFKTDEHHRHDNDSSSNVVRIKLEMYILDRLHIFEQLNSCKYSFYLTH